MPNEVVETTVQTFAEHKAARLGVPDVKSTPEPKTDSAKVELTEEEKAQKTRDVADLRYRKRAQEAEARAAAAERKAAELEAKINPPVLEDKPKRADFKDDDEYAEAYAEWRDNKREADKASKALRDAWTKSAEETKAEFPDFDEVMADGANIEVNGWVIKALSSSEMLPRLQYHLGTHPEELEALQALKSPEGVIKAVGRLEDRLAKKAPLVEKKEEAPAVKLVSSAPAPIDPIKGGGSPLVVSATEKHEGSFSDYKAKRMAGQIK